MTTKVDEVREQLYKLSRRDILEITVGYASTRNLIEDLIDLHCDSSDMLDELLVDCREAQESAKEGTTLCEDFK